MKFAGLAASGDTIRLASGTYSGVTLQNIVKSGNVTITSRDPFNPAVLTDLFVKTSQGLTFSNLEFKVTTDMPFQVLGSSRINFDGLDVHGTLNGSSNDDHRAMIVRGSDTVSVTNSHFHELTDALVHDQSRNLNFAGNLFDLIRDNGISGGGSSYVTITGNVFKDFDHVGAVHPDAIQFWTSNTSASATDITVSGNVFNRGNGAVVQGIFIQDDVGTLPYQRVTVSDNVVIGGAYNGILVNGATNATLSNNVVLGETDQASWLGSWNVASANWSGNLASSFSNQKSTVNGSADIQTTPLSMVDAAALSAQLNALAIPGQLAGVAAKFSALALAQVYWLDYIDIAPANSTVVFDLVPLDGTSAVNRLVAPALGTYYLRGFAGDDTLVGGTSGHGSNILEGGTGNDIYTVYSAADVVVENPGEGTDTIYTFVDYTLPANVESIKAFAAGITVHGNAGNNFVTGVAGGNTLYGEAGDDTVQGNSGNDLLFGNDGNDRLFGNDGNDRLDGGNGDDTLYGGNGNDTLIGGAGNDYIEGGAGADVLTGGVGADMFNYRPSDFVAGLNASRDIITDFNAAQGDKISLVGLDAKAGTTVNDAFTFIGNQAFHGVAGELRFALAGDGIDVLGDTNGDRVADIAIHLTALTSITSSSFIL
ncbi:MAG: right-handed parallel beta-helix repeat-containing protein [Novosphingobium sp.]